MMRLLVPAVLLVLGLGAGAGAGLLLARPEPEEAASCAPASEPPSSGVPPAARPPGSPRDYVRLNNQFVVPVLRDGLVASLVLLSLSVETADGRQEEVLAVEPKLRDLFLQVLFDHANAGGFEGVFTAASAMRSLRGALLAATRADLGDLVSDVLVTDLVRQDA
ncbi:flagellar basal body-associated protein FliL [Rubellimicrobium sp. CFH 75288]|uniref:flagellar basal body-associated protein FliL n=1 Tax=Rubellimicrobium sp. CFH 75288 TaxID=2697034 RepID=UPI00141325E9|nr:flagellar basal body-associated protein FliL [Rubellimicrobium sp. CFH 75288]NAZ37288.1 flagellar basal body-associated protein FliL [Rubellimicrobium sp. CFH 75288]